MRDRGAPLRYLLQPEAPDEAHHPLGAVGDPGLALACKVLEHVRGTASPPHPGGVVIG